MLPSPTSTARRILPGAPAHNRRVHLTNSRKVPLRARVPCLQAAAATELKEQLISAILENKQQKDSFNTGLPPEAQKIIDQMEAEAQKSKPELIEDELLGNFDGVGSRIVSLDEASTTSLGQASFQQFKPTDLQVKVTGGGTVTNRMNDREPYATVFSFRVVEGEFEGVEGIQKAIAEWSIDEQDPAKMYVTFVRIQFEPRQKDAESVQRFKACFKEHNPGMDEDGICSAKFDKGRRGHRDFVYVDKDFQVSKGNRGSWTVLERRPS